MKKIFLKLCSIFTSITFALGTIGVPAFEKIGYNNVSIYAADASEKHSIYINNIQSDGSILKGSHFVLKGIESNAKGNGEIPAIEFEASDIINKDELDILKSNGKSIEWISGEAPLNIMLADGTYTLTEEVVPEGFVRADDVSFLVSDGIISYINNKQTSNSVFVYVTNQSTKEYPIEAESPELMNVQCGNNVYFTLYKDGTVSICGNGEIFGYSEYIGSPWRRVGLSESIKRIVISDGVTGIGEYTFWFCSNLESVKIPYGVESIGSCAFSDCINLKEITIPASVREIRTFAFGDCSNLEKISFLSWNCQITDSKYEFPEETTIYGYKGSTAEEYAQKYNRSFTAIDIASGKCGDDISYTLYEGGTMNISGTGSMWTFKDENAVPWAEYKQDIKKVIIGDGITGISDYAFFGLPYLTEITIPKSVKSIGRQAISSCYELKSVTVSATNIGELAFAYCDKLDNVTLLDGVTTIGSQAFYQCYQITSITIPDSVEAIGNSAFNGCKSLKDVKIPDSVERIDGCAFSECINLKEITIPASVKEIGGFAFGYCSSLKKISFLNPECQITDDEYQFPEETTIYGYKGSTAEEYAQKYNRSFVEIAPTITTVTTESTTTTTIKTTTTTAENTTKANPNTTTATTTITTIVTTIPEKENKFTYGANNWSFTNSSNNFGNTYYISESYYNKLIKGLSKTDKEQVYDILHDEWRGSCYGMAITSILSCYGILNPSEWQGNANFLHDIDAPPNSDIKSLINYYFAMQATDYVSQYTNYAVSIQSEEEKLKNLIAYLEDGSPTLLTFFFYMGGHAVVAYGVEYGTWVKNGVAYNGRVLTYDNNDLEFNENRCLYFNSSKWTWTIPHYGANSTTGAMLGLITDDLGIINYNGHLGEQTIEDTDIPYVSVLNSTAISTDYSLKKIDFNNGKWTINSSTADDDIKMFSAFTDSQNPGNVKFALKDSTKGYVIQLQDMESIDLNMRYPDSLLYVSAKSAEQVVFDPSGYIELQGTATDYNFDVVFNDGHYPTDWYKFSVSGSNIDNATIKQTDEGYVLNASNLDNVKVKAKSDLSYAEVDFSTDYNEVLLYEIDEKTIGVAVDTDKNGTYETTIFKSEEETSLGDVNNDSHVDATDASLVLAEYALLSTGGESSFTEEQHKAADVDNNDMIDASDASLILAFYAYLSTGGEISDMRVWLETQ